MVTVMECSVVTPEGMGRPGTEKPSRLPLTLADLITAVQDVVGPEDDGLVVATVRDLLGAGRLTGAGPEPVGAPRRARRRGAGKFPFSRVRASARHRMADPRCSDAAVTAERGDTTIPGRALADRICMATTWPQGVNVAARVVQTLRFSDWRVGPIIGARRTTRSARQTARS
jgi:hypothetical protein